MSTVMTGRLDRALRVWQLPIGKKAVMAITGVILFGYVLGHMLGNLQIYLGAEVLDGYARTLHATPTLLWGVRLLLLVSVVLHITSAVQLTMLSQKARPAPYKKHASVASTYAARTMIWSGILIAAFVVYHILHFTTGDAHPSFEEGHVFDNVVSAFRDPMVSGAYIICMILLGMHLYHGLWSMFQSVGLASPRYTPLFKRFAAVFAFLIVAGDISIPISVMAGVVG